MNPTLNSGSGGAVGLAAANLSRSRKQVLDLINRLHNTGVGREVDLPLIAVIGSQSAGKSSLIESISGITLPRAAGTCTRCPTECRLVQSGDDWKCIVRLRFTTDRRGHPITPPRIISFGSPILNRSEVEERIRRAQKAILNPSQTDATVFLDNTFELEGDNEIDFSASQVCLEISGPEITDLTFIDLPGLIQTTGSRGQESDIQLVEDLVSSYISRPNCLILLTTTCEVDFQTQGAHRLAKRYDEEGARTVGVLTKPDRIDAGNERLWTPLIRNEEEPLKNNWYCVKQPSPSDLSSGITWQGARDQEVRFFETHAPWSELEDMYKAYLGTPNLVERLSELLSDLIQEKLPEIEQHISRELEIVRNALASLPKEPSNDPFHEIFALLQEFFMDVSKTVEGIPEEGKLLQTIRPRHERFRRAIRNTAPRFSPFERNKWQSSASIPFLENEDGAETDGEDTSDHETEQECALSDQEEAQSVSTDRVVDDPYEEAVDGHYEMYIDAPARPAPHPKTIFIDEVMWRAHNARTRELPHNYPFVVQQAYVSEFYSKWTAPSLTLASFVKATLIKTINDVVRERFCTFGQGHLERRMRAIMQNHILKCFKQCVTQIEWVHSLEDRPFTLNEHYLNDYKVKFKTKYSVERQTRLGSSKFLDAVQTYKPLAYNSYGAQPTATGIHKIIEGFTEVGQSVVASDLPKILPWSDPMEPALNIMADVRAYFQVAYKRYADMIPLAIDKVLIRGITNGLSQFVVNELGILGPEGTAICKDLAREDSRVAERRRTLRARLETLERASSELMIGF
ncbi:P-loop containing nucleoside triphosphate hydrolase protein [Flagelloscypha sp. PMI_526]|nr:P-loop containing nucleoside triphosphate hydrolase protein [Flagelloscypha sp. PMI_526]